MKNRALIPIVVGTLLACSECDFGKGGGLMQPGISEQHVVAVPDSPKFLTEEMALSAARVTLDLDRLWSTNWHPVPDNRTAAPDGRRDELLASNTINSNRGFIAFTNDANSRFVLVEVQGNRLLLKSSLSK